jgi:hypothetical protein
MERLSKEMGCSIEEAIRWSRNQVPISHIFQRFWLSERDFHQYFVKI